MQYVQFISMQAPFGWLCLAVFWVLLITGAVIGVSNSVERGKLLISIGWVFYAVLLLSTVLNIVLCFKNPNPDAIVPLSLLVSHILLNSFGFCCALIATMLALIPMFCLKKNRSLFLANIPLFSSLGVLIALFLLLHITFGTVSPASRNPTVWEINEIEETRTVRIDVATNGLILCRGTPFSKSSLTNYLSKQLSGTYGQHPVVIRGESGCTFETLQPIVKLCEEVGINAVALQLTDVSIDELSKPEDAKSREPYYWHYRGYGKFWH